MSFLSFTRRLRDILTCLRRVLFNAKAASHFPKEICGPGAANKSPHIENACKLPANSDMQLSTYWGQELDQHRETYGQGPSVAVGVKHLHEIYTAAEFTTLKRHLRR
jgi:hypothetical protein